jgi:cytochrome P450
LTLSFQSSSRNKNPADLQSGVESRVFQLALPLQSVVVVADGLSARRVLESSSTLVEKPLMAYSDFDGITQYQPTLFTMQTRNPKWAHRRKGLAPAFSSRRIR